MSKSSALLVVCIIGAVVVASAFEAAPTFTSLVVSNCNSSDCTTGCSNFTLPLRKCERGQTFSCHNTLAKCAHLTRFAQGSNCTGASEGSLPLQCGYCMRIQVGNGPTQFGRLEGCETNRLVFSYNCQAGCTNCTTRLPIPQGQCVISPVDNRPYTLTSINNCGTVVSFRTWNNTDCSGRTSEYDLNVANQCYPDGKTNGVISATKFYCI